MTDNSMFWARPIFCKRGACHYQFSSMGFGIMQNLGFIPWFLIWFQWFPANYQKGFTYHVITFYGRAPKFTGIIVEVWLLIPELHDFTSDLHWIPGAIHVIQNRARPLVCKWITPHSSIYLNILAMPKTLLLAPYWLWCSVYGPCWEL